MKAERKEGGTVKGRQREDDRVRMGMMEMKKTVATLQR